jgi:hypothetical protein
MHAELNAATEPGNDPISTDELQYPVERKVSLMTKPPGACRTVAMRVLSLKTHQRWYSKKMKCMVLFMSRQGL